MPSPRGYGTLFAPWIMLAAVGCRLDGIIDPLTTFI
jgi:hypothetical protein